MTFNVQFAAGKDVLNKLRALQLYHPSSSDGPVVSNGCARSQTRTFTAIDACGNTATASRTVTWTADVTAPVITATGGFINPWM